jgi:hypothetical protein
MKTFKKAVAGIATLGLFFVLTFGTSLTAQSSGLEGPSHNHRKKCWAGLVEGCKFKVDKTCFGSNC